MADIYARVARHADQLISYLKRLRLSPSSPAPTSPLYAPLPPTLHATLLAYTRAGYLERGKNAGAQPTQTQHQTQRRNKGRQTQTQTQHGRSSAAQGSTAREEEEEEAGDPSVEWRWGARAEIELGEKAVARFVQAIYESGGTEPTGVNGGEEGEEQTQQQEETGAGARGGKGRTGEKLMREIARAAGTKRLEDATVSRQRHSDPHARAGADADF